MKKKLFVPSWYILIDNNTLSTRERERENISKHCTHQYSYLYHHLFVDLYKKRKASHSFYKNWQKNLYQIKQQKNKYKICRWQYNQYTCTICTLFVHTFKKSQTFTSSRQLYFCVDLYNYMYIFLSLGELGMIKLSMFSKFKGTEKIFSSNRMHKKIIT